MHFSTSLGRMKTKENLFLPKEHLFLPASFLDHLYQPKKWASPRSISLEMVVSIILTQFDCIVSSIHYISIKRPCLRFDPIHD